jgi:hypothetical protein
MLWVSKRYVRQGQGAAALQPCGREVRKVRQGQGAAGARKAMYTHLSADVMCLQQVRKAGTVAAGLRDAKLCMAM